MIHDLGWDVWLKSCTATRNVDLGLDFDSLFFGKLYLVFFLSSFFGFLGIAGLGILVRFEF